MQLRDGRGTYRFIARYGDKDAHEHDGVGHSHPLGAAQHRHGEPSRYWRREEYQDGIAVRTLGRAG